MQGQVEIDICAPPLSIVDESNGDAREPTPPILEATLVEDEPEEPEEPVYNAVAIPTIGTKTNDAQPPFCKVYQKYVIGFTMALLLATTATVIGILVSSGKEDDGIMYYADRENLLCNNEPSNSMTHQLSLYETLEECCEEE